MSHSVFEVKLKGIHCEYLCINYFYCLYFQNEDNQLSLDQFSLLSIFLGKEVRVQIPRLQEQESTLVSVLLKR